ncbi:DNA topoisomerase IB [Allocatelliglobosispora scoriae]|uniref:DNA topoisomerase n=1 Tax=Allocatelliglobosispora scoriae TaxID=643052 RepID=A0A841BKL0_9ACTN|nr:DNA topoisomerase IB [Allocatelliglobosispora scoriae]MBB5867350.1 DNA topoisomerase IB [Allocatelliglobosispora scoriae]
MARLRRSDSHSPGIERVRRGRGFSYHCGGSKVTDPETLARIDALVLPPAWDKVWICPDPRGHLQAVGVDAAGRRQYRYHDQWRVRRDAAKFEHMLDVAATLPALRAAVATDLVKRSLARERVLAGAARLLDTAVIRVGGEGYAKDDPVLGEATFGLATLRRDHATVTGSSVHLRFSGKGGHEFDLSVPDRSLATLVRRLLDRDDDNAELFAWKDADGWHDLRTQDINDYLRTQTGIELTAKDFRTWHATVAAAVSLACSAPSQSASARRKAVSEAMRDVSDLLGNTPTVARKSYVDPRLIDAFHHGDTIPVPEGTDVASAFADRRVWADAEAATADLLSS